MKNITHFYTNTANLDAFFSSSEIRENTKSFYSVLVQAFISQNRMDTYREIYTHIKQYLPDAVVTGATTIGGIVAGKLQTGEIILNFSFFTHTRLCSIGKTYQENNEYDVGLELAEEIAMMQGPIAGALMFCTPLTNNVSDTLRAISQQGVSYPLFGGGAAAYDLVSGPTVFYGDQMVSNGVVLILLLSDCLKIFTASHLGWEKMGVERVVTSAYGKVVNSIDHYGAYDFYHHYLGVANDEQFYFNSLEFPLLLKHHGFTLARVPFLVRDGSIEFCAAIEQGEHVTLGYGDPQAILGRDMAIHRDIAHFAPEAIFLYSCVCRRFLLQEAIDLETTPFSQIAPTAGFYTSGEIFTIGEAAELLNSALVVVGMREDCGTQQPTRQERTALEPSSKAPPEMDPYVNKHSRIISQLLHYINLQTSELEEANAVLQHIAETDQLTRIHNRVKIDHLLADEIRKGHREHYRFSVIMIDVDNFKLINDKHGHLVGDDVLMQLSDLLQTAIRKTDYVGRWGGEEFLIIMPFAAIEQAKLLAERIRVVISEYQFPKAEHITCSLGVTEFLADDTESQLLQRADEALYWAKNNGRNQVNSNSK